MSFQDGCRALLDNRFDDASSIFKTLLKSQGENPHVRHNLGLSYECQRRFAEAFKEYSTVLEKNPGHWRSALGLANLYLYGEDLENGEGLARLAVQLAPDHPQPRIVLAEILCLRGLTEEAIKVHRRGVENVLATDGMGVHSHVLVYMDLGTTDETTVRYQFLEKSVLDRDNAFPTVVSSSYVPGEQKVALVAHAGNIPEVRRRLRELPRAEVVVITLDELSQRVLKDDGPTVTCAPSPPWDCHEYPSIQLRVLRDAGIRNVLVPVSDHQTMEEKMRGCQGGGNTNGVSEQGDLWIGDENDFDFRFVPPLLHKGESPPADIFAKIFLGVTQ